MQPRGAGRERSRVRQFSFQLDDERAVAVKYLGGPESDGTIPHFQMCRNDTEAFLLMAYARSGHYTWHVEIPCVVNGVRFRLPVKHEGKPLATVGWEGLVRYAWVSECKEWVGPGESHFA